MSIKHSETESHIKETAKKIFFKEGRYDATTQNIADAAGVNRSLLHYYFRSRDILLEKVLVEGQVEFSMKMSENMNKGQTFKERISHFIDAWMEHTAEYPYLDAFLVARIHNGALVENIRNEHKKHPGRADNFFKEIEKEMNEGRLKQMDPVQFLLNLISMVAYPLIMRPLMEKSFALSKKNYNKILEERKAAIMTTLFT